MLWGEGNDEKRFFYWNFDSFFDIYLRQLIHKKNRQKASMQLGIIKDLGKWKKSSMCTPKLSNLVGVETSTSTSAEGGLGSNLFSGIHIMPGNGVAAEAMRNLSQHDK